MKNNYPYLKDSSFLETFDREHNQEQYAKITVLTLDEKPLQAFEGRVVSGTINLDGQSSIRRTANITMVADEYENDLTNVDNIISINKKIELEIGFVNPTTEYTNYPMIWFPLGIYVIITPSISFGSGGVSISLQLKDKMCLLNGDCGGTLPASVIFNEYDEIDEYGRYITTNPTIYQIIQELVNHWGGEQLGKIIISDVDTRIRKVMKWTGTSPLYIIKKINSDGTIQYTPTMNSSQIGEDDAYDMYETGMDVGYVFTDFIYGEDLISNAGDSVCTILDKIKEYLGNYEYFYDTDGNFVFQEIKNYLNTSQATIELDKITKEDYLVDQSKGKAVYVFDDSNTITEYTNAPQYDMIKNDFIVWGTRKNANDVETPCRYHLSIDSKPLLDTSYEIFFYTDPTDNLVKAKYPIRYPTKDSFPDIGQAEVFYMDLETGLIYEWNGDNNEYVVVAEGLVEVTPTDWRTALYLEGASAESSGANSNYYYTELEAEWPKLYDVQNGEFYEEVLKDPYDIDYFLDFIDSGAAISKINISNIGRRTKVVVDDDVNCVFEPNVPNLVLLEASSANLTEEKEECEAEGQDYIQLESSMFSLLGNGGGSNSAYQYVRDLLYQYTSYNESINLTVLPIYYLEPNTRITVRCSRANIYGDYMMNSISIPLDTSGTMTISATRALERI